MPGLLPAHPLLLTKLGASEQTTARSLYVCSIKLEIASFSIIVKHYIASCAHSHTSTHRVHVARVHLHKRMELARRRELGRGRRWPQALPPLGPLPPLPPLSLSAATIAATHRRCLHLHPPRFSAFPSAMPSALGPSIAAAHRYRPRRVGRRRQHRPPASATAIAASCVATTAKGRGG